MKCPRCKERKNVEVNFIAGYAQDIRECGKCGLTWTFIGDELVILE